MKSYDNQLKAMRDESAHRFPERLTIGTSGVGTREHALCDEGIVVAEVLATGYPIGKGWDPRSAALTKELAHRYNTHVELLEALERILPIVKCVPDSFDIVCAAITKARRVA